MNGRSFEILLPMAGDNNYYPVCRCDSIESAIAVVKALMEAGSGSPGEIRILTRYCD